MSDARNPKSPDDDEEWIDAGDYHGPSRRSALQREEDRKKTMLAARAATLEFVLKVVAVIAIAYQVLLFALPLFGVSVGSISKEEEARNAEYGVFQREMRDRMRLAEASIIFIVRDRCLERAEQLKTTSSDCLQLGLPKAP